MARFSHSRECRRGSLPGGRVAVRCFAYIDIYAEGAGGDQPAGVAFIQPKVATWLKQEVQAA
jgi:hypothetical protein